MVVKITFLTKFILIQLLDQVVILYCQNSYKSFNFDEGITFSIY